MVPGLNGCAVGGLPGVQQPVGVARPPQEPQVVILYTQEYSLQRDSLPRWIFKKFKVYELQPVPRWFSKMLNYYIKILNCDFARFSEMTL